MPDTVPIPGRQGDEAPALRVGLGEGGLPRDPVAEEGVLVREELVLPGQLPRRAQARQGLGRGVDLAHALVERGDVDLLLLVVHRLEADGRGLDPRVDVLRHEEDPPPFLLEGVGAR